MEKEKLDRRIRYSKKMIRESFIELLSQKPISQISIKELCEHADVNRATFYAHYTDQSDLLKQIENDLAENIMIYLKEGSLENPKKAYSVEKIFKYIKDNAKICKLLLSESGDLSFQKRVMMLVYDLIISELTNKSALSVEDAQYIYSFIITGCIGVVQKWLGDGMKKPPQEMADLILKLTQALMG